MLIEVSVASALGAVVAVQLQRRYLQRRDGKRREQMLIDALQQTGIDQPPPKQYLTGRRVEMELLLLHLRTASENLSRALAAEARLGRNLGGRAAESQVVFEHWQIARRAIGQAQETYDQAVNEYRGFVQGVPAPLRAKATEKGTVAMMICHS